MGSLAGGFTGGTVTSIKLRVDGLFEFELQTVNISAKDISDRAFDDPKFLVWKLALTGADRLDGGAGADALSGEGGFDTFVFADGYGKDTVTDFVAGRTSGDRIEFDVGSISTFAELMTHAAQAGLNTVFTFDGGTILKLRGVDMSDINTDDIVLL